MATIRDVARAADVSIATVSRALNGSSRVADKTSRRVWNAATDLDYWPNGAAQSLTTSRTHTIGVLLPDLYGDFFSEIIRGIDLTARSLGHQVLISSSHANTEEVVTAARSMRGRIDGLILMAPDQGSAEVIDRVSRRFPVVLLNPRSTVDTCSTVSIANFDGASAVVRHLLDVGHRRIVIINGPPGNVDAAERQRGYREALARAKVPHDGSLELQGDFTESSGYELAARVLDLRPRPTAIFSTNDCMAVGVLSALSSLGIDVPGDIAVAGFDDVTIARYMNPPLTTAHVDAFQLGSRAVSLLIAAKPSASPSHELIDAQLVVRSSCGARSARTTNRSPTPLHPIPEHEHHRDPGSRHGRHQQRRCKP